MPQLIPVVLAVSAIAGVGLQAVGTAQAASAAKKRSDYEQQIAQEQQQQENLRRQQMELENRRRQLEAVRNSQKARSLALSTAANQGGQFGSGLQGGFGQISGDVGNDLLGLSQNLALGRATFDSNANISQYRYGIASANSAYSTGQGLSSLGGGIVSSLGEIGRLSGGFFPGSSSYGGSGSAYTPFGGGSAGAIY